MITTKSKIAHYEVLRPLSEGGFGTTYLVRDTHIHPPAENRRIIKQLKPIENDPKIYELIKDRFKQEAKIIETLGKGHSQVPVLYGYFEEAGNFYLVEEYIEGKTLDQVIAEKGTLEETEVKGILENLVKVLDYLQENRVIHRDIKPENIILRESDGKPVLIDFGTMKQSMGTTLTTSGNNTRSIVIGTPGFMPPEQMIGRPVFASDIYALGLTAIFLLTGKRPEELETDPESGQLLWEKEAPNVSTGLAQILNQAIASQAKERFMKAKPLAEALNNPQAYSQTTTERPAVAPTYVVTPTPQEVNNVHPADNKPITQVSQVMSQMNPLQKTLSIILVLVTFLAGIGGITSGILNVMRFLDERNDDPIAVEPGPNTSPTPTPSPSPDIIDRDPPKENTTPSPKPQPRYTPTPTPTYPPSTRTAKPSCGSPRGSGSIWYAVVGETNALSTVKSQYCADALIIRGNTQAASFTSRQQAENFAQYLRRETGYSFWVKEPRRVDSFTPPPVSYAPPSPSLPYRSTCGDPFVSGATWYAVIGSRSTLGRVKSNYCGDAIINGSGNAQVASFTSRSRAENFARQLENATGMNFWVK